jgi:hypothetical protein
MCQKRMKEGLVFGHLDSCRGPSPISVPEPPDRQQGKTLERLPALNYSMLKEPALRKKMSELGLSNSGPRSLLERRHKEWITIWNANCDSSRPKRRRDLLHDLEVWERTQGSQTPVLGRPSHGIPVVKDKDFDGDAWAAKHQASYDDLIATAKKTRLEAKRTSAEATLSLPNEIAVTRVVDGEHPRGHAATSGNTQEQSIAVSRQDRKAFDEVSPCVFFDLAVLREVEAELGKSYDDFSPEESDLLDRRMRAANDTRLELRDAPQGSLGPLQDENCVQSS